MNATASLSVTTGPIHVGDDVCDSDLAQFLDTTSGATPFHSAAWGRAIEQACGHRWHMLGARDAAGRLVGVLPLHHIRSRLFGTALVSSGFAVDGGILVSDQSAIMPLAVAAIELADDLGVANIELRGGECPTGWALDSESHLGFVRALAADSEAELLATPKRHRAEVRKALANPLDVAIGRGAADRDAHFATYATSVRNLGTPVFPKQLFAAVLDQFGDAADILTVRHGGKAVASVLSLYWQGAVMPYWGGGSREARALRANERMYFSLMEHGRQRGMARFDFGRSKAGSGPAAYKRNWGFDAEPLCYARWSRTGVVRDMNPTSGKYQLMVRAWKRLPLPIANRIGPFIARQLG